MNIQNILSNPDLIDTLDSKQKTELYFQLNNLKDSITNKINENKAKKESRNEFR